MILSDRRGLTALALLTAALLAAIAAGCGNSSSTEPLTKAEFVAQADAICASAQQERKSQSKELVEQNAEAAGSEEAEAATQQLLEPVEKMTEELADLGPPKGDAQEVAAIIAAFEKGSAAVSADPTGPKVTSAYGEANQLAAEYGLADCSI